MFLGDTVRRTDDMTERLVNGCVDWYGRTYFGATLKRKREHFVVTDVAYSTSRLEESWAWWNV